MRRASMAILALLAFPASTLLAQTAEEAESRGLLSLHSGLMFWTLVIFVVLLFVLSKFAFKPITAAVEEREAALQKALDEARRDRDEAAALLAQHRTAISEARAEAQRYIAEGRQAGERVRTEMLEHTRAEQAEMMERIRREIAQERDRAVAQLRRETADLAIRGASRVIERNLDTESNRALVEEFLASVASSKGAAA